jgi:(1->4)-alpha-D-glucan 1-alpha-D-glucosylmutase
MSDDLLYEIAARAGVARAYRDARGQHVESPRHAIELVLAALGFEVGSPEACRATLARLDTTSKALVPGTIPVTSGEATIVPLQAEGEVSWVLSLEDGQVREGRTGVETRDDRRVLVLDALPPGYHVLRVETGRGAAETTLIAAPRACFIPPALSDGGRGFGITAQVYGLRSATNYGIGDFSDVADLAEGAGHYGAAFLGLSPLHALFPNDRGKISPYAPSSRLFIDPIYIDPAQLPNFAASTAARTLNETGIGHELDRLRATDLVDHAGSWGIKRTVLAHYWARFENTIDPAFAEFRKARGETLEAYATFEALSEHFAAQGKQWIGEWPEAYRDAKSEAVRQFRDGNPSRIAFHAWLQWIADTQLAQAQARARSAGMPIGLYRDLAVGVDRAGAEHWSRPDWFIPGMAVGAPPDPLGPSGQNWGLPPFNPRTLEAQGLLAFRTLVAANMRHAGAIRIDHAFQLQRLFIVPDGLSAAEGVYVNYPFEAMLAVLRLESHRARALVIAEDLGTAPDGFSDAIMRSDLLSYRIMNFEREHGGAFKAPAAYPRKALAAVATHDLPTFAGWWKDLDTDLRESLNVFSPEQAQREREDRVRDLAAFADALAHEQILHASTVPVDPPVEEAFRFLAKTPAMLVALQLEDILGDTNQANMPGPDVGHPNWRRRLARSVDAILVPGGPLARAADVMVDEGRALTTLAPRLAWPPPAATYRLQLFENFTFDQAIETLPYLRRLGVTHVYVSPILKARPGSTHGYDTVDPLQINPELGGLPAFERFAAALKAQHMQLIVDIVPNHMGVGGADNPWWLSVLEWGESSPFAETFDIDWERFGANGKMVAPFLGAQYGEVLEKGDLKLAFDPAEGSFSVWHYEHRFPICPLTYPLILDRAVAVDGSEGGEGIDGLLRVAEELRALADEPAHRRHDILAACARLKQRLVILAGRANVAQAIEQAVAVLNGTPGLPESFGALHRLLEQQAYRLAFWRVAASDVNYRRFFDIDSLAGVRVERPQVFERTHQLIFQLIRRGFIQGLRIDHIDGLADPKAYAAALQAAVGPNFYVVVEKILEPGEALRQWPISGTTGYEMLNLIDGLFVDAENKKVFDRLYKDMTGFKQSYKTALLSAKRQVLFENFSSELESLVSDAKKIAEANRLTRDHTLNALRNAIGDMICVFPVYRTYVSPRGIETEDRVLLGKVDNDARALSTLPDRSVYDFLESIMLGTLPTGRPGRAPIGLIDRFRRRFQQLTGPVMAKSLEDTLFYRYARFLVLNEVGGEPSHFGVSLTEFHAANRERAQLWPQALTTTATHDTKRGEDARARLLALSETPDLWAQALAIWKAEVGEIEAPDTNDQYMLLQTLLGVWPIELLDRRDGSILEELRKRLATYVTKALREAKRHSRWIEPNELYEKATIDLIDRLLGDQSHFIERLQPILADLAQRGMLVSLMRTVLKCTVPGVPDFYQGTGLWDFSLVDPDNRRPVDYAERADAIAAGASLADLLAHWKDGRVKLKLTADLLRDRRDHALFYAKADYVPLTVTGDRAKRLIAFSRRHKGETIVVLGPRLAGSGIATATVPVGAAYWGSTTISLPQGRWRDIFEGGRHETNGTLKAADILATLPFAVLRMDG